MSRSILNDAKGERRAARLFDPQAEFRMLEEDGQPAKIVGYGIKWNTPSNLIVTRSEKNPNEQISFRETIDAGAFDASMADAGRDIWAIVEHDDLSKLGRRSRGTMALRSDNQGLWVEIVPPDTTVGRDAIASVKRGDLDGMSVCFKPLEESWSKGADGVLTRRIHRANLFEVSLTGFPAYPDTTAALRSMAAAGLDTQPATVDLAERDYALEMRIKMLSLPIALPR